MSRSQLLKEWEMTRDDLKIDIVAPYELDLGNGTIVKADVLVKDFGGRNGMLVFTNESTFWQYHDTLSKLHYGVVLLEEPSDPYDHEVMMEMLSDWGWTGDETKKPDWIKDPPAS